MQLQLGGHSPTCELVSLTHLRVSKVPLFKSWQFLPSFHMPITYQILRLRVSRNLKRFSSHKIIDPSDPLETAGEFVWKLSSLFSKNLSKHAIWCFKTWEMDIWSGFWVLCCNLVSTHLMLIYRYGKVWNAFLWPFFLCVLPLGSSERGFVPSLSQVPDSCCIRERVGCGKTAFEDDNSGTIRWVEMHTTRWPSISHASSKLYALVPNLIHLSFWQKKSKECQINFFCILV